MTLDDEHIPWPVADALERGELPPTSPREHAVLSLVAVLDVGQCLSDGYRRRQAAALIENRGLVKERLAALEADPHRVVLKQQRHAELDSVTWWTEHAGHLKREYEDALAVLERVKRAEGPQLVDRDERGADEDDTRISVERVADEVDGPRVA